MYKVLIADDESIIRNALANSVNWADFGMEIVGLGKNGREALSLVETLRPDICLLDIQMPLLNGLELIREINAIDKGVVKVIISGHDEFEYARKAVDLGVYSYILKPIDEDEFAGLLREIRQKLDAERRAALVNRRKDGLLQSGRKLLRDGLLSEWISGGIEPGEKSPAIEDCFEELGFQFAEITGMLWVSISFPMGIIENESVKKQQMLQCRSRLEKHFASDTSFCYIQLFSDSFLLLYGAGNTGRWDSIQQELTPLICKDNSWATTIRKKLVKGGYENLREAFVELNQGLNSDVRYMPMVKRVKKYVDENYQDMDLRLSTFSEHNNVSLSYISKLFKHETGVSFSTYLIRHRIKHSLEFLADTDYKVYEIAELVGYSSQHYYCEAFKKEMGMAPTEYRRKKR